METFRGGTSDPYVVINVGHKSVDGAGKTPREANQKCRSTVKKKTLEPEWDERFELVLPSPGASKGGGEDAAVGCSCALSEHHLVCGIGSAGHLGPGLFGMCPLTDPLTPPG